MQLFRWVFLFVGLLMLTFPVSRPYLPDFGKWLSPLTTPVAEWVAVHGWRVGPGFRTELSSDSCLLYVHVGNVFLVSLLGAIAWAWADRRRTAYPKLLYWLHAASRYYVAAAMLKYGFVKVFGLQFYVPEPNTLFTPLGDLPKDLLYWSTMGVSPGYSIFLGSVEVLVGLLLLWRKTAMLGAMIGMAVLVNVLAVNLSFGISVKLYSGILLLLCSVVLAPDFQRLSHFFRGMGAGPSTNWAQKWKSGSNRITYLLIKTIVIAALLFDGLAIFVESQVGASENTANHARHGAYDVSLFIRNGDTIPPDLREAWRWRRVFVHRDGFWIVQEMGDAFQDHALDWNEAAQRISIVDPETQVWGQFDYVQVGDSLLALTGRMNADSLRIHLRQLDWRKMPLLNSPFQWCSDTL